MTPERDVAAFQERATSYEDGWLGRLHHEIGDRTADLVVTTDPRAYRLLDVGCGTGYLLRLLADHLPEAELVGVDPAPSMIGVASASDVSHRSNFAIGVAEQLPFADDGFDLVVTTTSFDHWADQAAGLRECSRLLRPGGHLVLVDQCSPWLLPTLALGRRGKARTRGRCRRLLAAAGFSSLEWHRVHAPIIQGVVASS